MTSTPSTTNASVAFLLLVAGAGCSPPTSSPPSGDGVADCEIAASPTVDVVWSFAEEEVLDRAVEITEVDGGYLLTDVEDDSQSAEFRLSLPAESGTPRAISGTATLSGIIDRGDALVPDAPWLILRDVDGAPLWIGGLDVTNPGNGSPFGEQFNFDSIDGEDPCLNPGNSDEQRTRFTLTLHADGGDVELEDGEVAAVTLEGVAMLSTNVDAYHFEVKSTDSCEDECASHEGNLVKAFAIVAE